jgi:hypothetical protein
LTITTATILDVAKASRSELRPGYSMRLFSEDVADLKGGTHYLAYMRYDVDGDQFVVDGAFFREVTKGQVQWADDDVMRQGLSLAHRSCR